MCLRKTTNTSRCVRSRPHVSVFQNADGVVFTMTVEYFPNKVAILRVKKGDLPEQLATSFAKQYGMRFDLVAELVSQIREKMGMPI